MQGGNLLVNQSINGGDTPSRLSLKFLLGPISKYIRLRYTSTVGNQAFQLIEIEFSGYGAITNRCLLTPTKKKL